MWDQSWDTRRYGATATDDGRDVQVPRRRLFTPDREEACLVDERYGGAHLTDAAALFDSVYERSGDGWIDGVPVAQPAPQSEGVTPLHPVFVRAAVWTVAPDRICVESASRESALRVRAVVERLEPQPRRRTREEHLPAHHDWLRHPTSKLRASRPPVGPRESLAALVVEQEVAWTATPHELLGGRSPAEVAASGDGLDALYELLEIVVDREPRWHVRDPGCVLDTFDWNRVRERLGIGRRWDAYTRW